MNNSGVSIIGFVALCSIISATTGKAQLVNPLNNNNSPLIRKEYEKIYGKLSFQTDRLQVRPNILLITSDQHSWMSIGYNDKSIKTPNLDRLAAMGVIFDRAYTCNPTSTPARSSMITGLYPSDHGAIALGTKLPETIPTIGNYFSATGYTSALIGKAHFMPLAGNAEFPSLEAYPILQDMSFWKKFNGPFYGFDYVELARNHGDEPHVGQHYALWMQRKLKLEGKDINSWKNWFIKPGANEYNYFADQLRHIVDENGATGKQQRGIWNIPEAYHLNTWIAEQTNAKIDEFAGKNKPFFIWASFFDPHPPYLVPEPWASMYKPEDMIIPDVPENDMGDMPYHYRMTQSDVNDWGKAFVEDGFPVHGFYSQNKETKKDYQRNMALYHGMISMMDNYIGVILDHLEAKGLLENTIIVFTTDHGNHIGTHRLSKKGGFAFEEDLKIPFVVSWKHKIPAGKRSNALISLVDLAPTFVSLTGYKGFPAMSGVNLMPLFTGQTDKLRNWVISENHVQRTKFYQKTYIEERYKITWYMHTDEGELFDLVADPHEYTNLWNSADHQQLKMQMLLRAMQADQQKEPCRMPRLAPA